MEANPEEIVTKLRQVDVLTSQGSEPGGCDAPNRPERGNGKAHDLLIRVIVAFMVINDLSADQPSTCWPVFRQQHLNLLNSLVYNNASYAYGAFF
jgi:hypothetical protein